MEYKITKVAGRYESNKEGVKYVAKNGNNYARVTFTVAEYGDRLISGFDFGQNLIEGAEISGKIEETEYNGKKYLNFMEDKKEKKEKGLSVEILALKGELNKIQSQLKLIIEHLRGTNRLDLTSAGTPIPDFHEVDEKKIETKTNSEYQEHKETLSNKLADDEIDVESVNF